MTNRVKPRLCCGIYFALLLAARPQRTNYSEHWNGDTDGLSETNVMLNLCKVVNPDYREPSRSKKDSFETTVSKYKACIISKSAYVNFTNPNEKSAFNIRVLNDYSTALKAMDSFVKLFVENGVSNKSEEALVSSLMELILADEEIQPEDTFYVTPDGVGTEKRRFTDLKEIYLQPFLLGVLHYLSQTQRDNRDGNETYNEWWHYDGTDSVFDGSFNTDFELNAVVKMWVEVETNKIDENEAEDPGVSESEIIEPFVETRQEYQEEKQPSIAINKDGKTIQIAMNSYGANSKQYGYVETVYEANNHMNDTRCTIIRQSTGERILLPTTPYVIGKSKSACSFVVEDSVLNDTHVVIFPESEEWVIRDLGSMNGTYIAGTRLIPNEKYGLDDGDEIQLGNEKFLVEIGGK